MASLEGYSSFVPSCCVAKMYCFICTYGMMTTKHASLGRIQNLQPPNRCASHNRWALALKKTPANDSLSLYWKCIAQALHMLHKSIALRRGNFEQSATFCTAPREGNGDSLLASPKSWSRRRRSGGLFDGLIG